jgi:MSHA type pilus biogenesis protein MshL
LRPSVPAADPWKSAALLETRPPSPRPAPTEKARAAPDDPRLRTPVTLRSDSTDLRSLLLGLSRQTGLNMNVASDVRGTVSANFINVPVSTALTHLLRPLGYGYKVSDDVVHVFKQDLETHIFHVDYLSSQRRGVTRATSSDRTLGANLGGFQFNSFGTGGSAQPAVSYGGQPGMSQYQESSSELSVTWQANFWSTLHDGLSALVFGHSTEKPASADAGGGSSNVDKEGRTLIVNPTAGTVLVRALPGTLEDVERYLRALQDGIQRQVVIEARILEVTLSDDFRFGVDFSNLPLLTKSAAANLGIKPAPPPPVFNAAMGATAPAGTITFGPGGPDWQVIVSALRGIGDVKMISSPRISALSNQKAMVKVVRDRVYYAAQVQGTVILSGTTVPGAVQFVPVVVPEGVLVDVIPHVAEDGMITMDIHPSFSQIINEKQAPQNQGSQPEVERREIETTVRVRSDETIAIGGLFSERTTDRITGIPGLMYLPLLGVLFRRTETVTEKTELIVLLTPRTQGGHLATEYLDRAAGK